MLNENNIHAAKQQLRDLDGGSLQKLKELTPTAGTCDKVVDHPIQATTSLSMHIWAVNVRSVDPPLVIGC